MTRATHATHKRRIGIVGARGYVGQELQALVNAHPQLELAFASSRSDAAPITPDQLGQLRLDALVLSLPNKETAPWVEAIEKDAPDTAIVDVSADHRFDDAWAYGLPEHHRKALRGHKRIANPGCYATGAQLALRPMLDVAAGVPHVFGVSGYSGAGTKPSPNNDPANLEDAVIPYGLVDHMHEKEISRHLHRQIAFMPHVAPFFRGITLTVSVTTHQPVDVRALRDRFEEAYAHEPLVKVQDAIPHVREAAGKHGATLGGVVVDESGRRAVVVCTLDNLLKGAATQALQNVNLALGLDELAGIPLEART